MLQPRYVPILTGKQGEIIALSGLRPRDRAALTPLIDVAPVSKPHPPRKGEPPKVPPDPKVVLRKLLRGLSEARGIYDTMLDLDGFERYRFGFQHPVEFAVATMTEPAPILVVSNKSSPDYLAAAAQANLQLQGRAVRLHVESYSTPSTLNRDAQSLLEALRTNRHAVDLVVDVGRLRSLRNDLDLVEVLELLDAASWRSVTLAGTSLPQNMASGSFQRIKRAEWDRWLTLQDAAFGQILGFGDYGITGPRPDDDGPRYNPAPHLRYLAHDHALLLWKGRKADPEEGGAIHQGQTYPDLCQALMARSAYGRRGSFAGKSFSWGDRMIWETAEGLRGSGGPGPWVQFATSHHLAMVCRHLMAYGLVSTA